MKVNLWSEKFKGQDHLGNVRINRRLIHNWTPEKPIIKMWTVLCWQRTGFPLCSTGLLTNLNGLICTHCCWSSICHIPTLTRSKLVPVILIDWLPTVTVYLYSPRDASFVEKLWRSADRRTSATQKLHSYHSWIYNIQTTL